jgi:hypothetical protein
VWSTEIGGDDCEGTVNAELDAWKAEHGGSLDTMFAAAGSLRGLSPFPPGHRPPTPPTHIDGWTTSRLYDSIVPPGPVPSLASLCMASR